MSFFSSPTWTQLHEIEHGATGLLIEKRKLSDFGQIISPSNAENCARIPIIHNVRCLLIDFSKAFDIVKHTIILSKLSALDLPSSALNWIIAFLTDHTQVCKTTDGRFSAMHPITRSIIQEPGIGPTLWIVMASESVAFLT